MTRTLIRVVSIILAALSLLVANVARSQFLTLAGGFWLRAHARYARKIEPQDATYAAGLVLLSNPTGAVFDFDPGDLVVKASTTGKTYTNTAPLHLGSNTTDAPVMVQADEPGSASSALPGEIDTVLNSLPASETTTQTFTPPLLDPATLQALVTPVTPPAANAFVVTTTVTRNQVSVRNPYALVGLDDESDDLLRIRCDEKLGSLSPNGPADAYRVAAREAKRANGTPIGVNRVRTMPTAACGIQVCVAAPSGAVPGEAGDLTTDLGCVAAAIRKWALPETIGCTVSSASPKIVDVGATLWCLESKLTDGEIRAAVVKALEAYFADPLSTPIGGHRAPGGDGYIFAEDLRATMLRARADGVSVRAFRAVVSPAGDIPIDAFEVPQLGSVALTIVRVPVRAEAV